jgi:hypothetical protein
VHIVGHFYYIPVIVLGACYWAQRHGQCRLRDVDFREAQVSTLISLVGLCVQNTVCSESRCALRLWYVDLVVSIEVAIEVCCCFTVFGY